MSKLSPDEVILGLLSRQVGHGYYLLEFFRQGTFLGKVWKLGTGQLYTILKRLERERFITGREMDSTDAPIKTVYWLTQRGQHHLEIWLNDPSPSPSTRHIRTEFLSRLFIARYLDLSVQPIIETQKQSCLHYRQKLYAQRENQASALDKISLELQIAEYEAILTWLETCTEMLNVEDV